MHVLPKTVEFEWDRGNLGKSYRKHGISVIQSEELFLDENILFIDDIKHSQKERRFIAIGKTLEDKILFAVFNFRKDKIRIISARPANKQERKQYEEKP
jgi:uncharacterized DUF497 family protein